MTAVIDHAPTRVVPVAELSRYYSGVFEWPTTIDSSTGDVVLRLGRVIDALFIRAGFAGEVHSVLVRHMLRAPIIVVPGQPADWVFLTQPRTTMRLSVWEDLVRIQVRWKRRGDAISLPALDSAEDGLRWLERPVPGPRLPPWSAVVAAARSASTLSGTW